MTYEEYTKKEAARISVAVRHLENGVQFADIKSVYIDESVEIEPGAEIGPCVTLEGKTKIGAGAVIRQNTRIRDSKIGRNTEVTSSVILDSEIGEDCEVGPFAYVRPNCRIGNSCKIGDFVEVKNSTVGDRTKASHLTYIGDADVGCDGNLGCGVVFVNYNGREKFRTTVGDRVFVGCNANLVAPVTVEDGAYVAAGSTITDDVPRDALGIARERQTNIEGWAAKKGLFRK